MQEQTSTKCLIPECPDPVKPYRGRGRRPKYCTLHEWGHLTREERQQHHIERMRDRQQRAASEHVRHASLIADLRAEIHNLRQRLAAIRSMVDGHLDGERVRKERAA